MSDLTAKERKILSEMINGNDQEFYKVYEKTLTQEHSPEEAKRIVE